MQGWFWGCWQVLLLPALCAWVWGGTALFQWCSNNCMYPLKRVLNTVLWDETLLGKWLIPPGCPVGIFAFKWRCCFYWIVIAQYPWRRQESPFSPCCDACLLSRLEATQRRACLNEAASSKHCGLNFVKGHFSSEGTTEQTNSTSSSHHHQNRTKNSHSKFFPSVCMWAEVGWKEIGAVGDGDRMLSPLTGGKGKLLWDWLLLTALPPSRSRLRQSFLKINAELFQVHFSISVFELRAQQALTYRNQDLFSSVSLFLHLVLSDLIDPGLCEGLKMVVSGLFEEAVSCIPCPGCLSFLCSRCFISLLSPVSFAASIAGLSLSVSSFEIVCCCLNPPKVVSAGFVVLFLLSLVSSYSIHKNPMLGAKEQG